MIENHLHWDTTFYPPSFQSKAPKTLLFRPKRPSLRKIIPMPARTKKMMKWSSKSFCFNVGDSLFGFCLVAIAVMFRFHAFFSIQSPQNTIIPPKAAITEKNNSHASQDKEDDEMVIKIIFLS